MFNSLLLAISSVFMFSLTTIFVAIGGFLLLFSERKIEQKRRISAINGEEKAFKLMDRFGGYDRLENVVVGSFDKFSKMAEVDALIHGKSCLMIIEIKNWSGVIYPNENDNYWLIKNAKNGAEYKRRNPLIQVNRQASILNQFYPNVKIIPMVLILGWNSFEGDIPEQLLTYKTINKISHILKESIGEDVENQVQLIWDSIVIDEFKPESSLRKIRYLKYIKKKYREPRAWLNLLFSSICFLFMTVSLIYYLYSISSYSN